MPNELAAYYFVIAREVPSSYAGQYLSKRFFRPTRNATLRTRERSEAFGVGETNRLLASAG